MKKQVLLLLGLSPLLSLAQPPKGSLAAALVGQWRNIYVHIDVKGKVMEADSSNWEQRLQIKPIRTFFQADGTYYSEYRNLQDSVVRRPAGTWTITGDSLTISQSTPDSMKMTFLLHIEKDVATFSGLIDFDGDGQNNDLYYGRQRRFR